MAESVSLVSIVASKNRCWWKRIERCGHRFSRLQSNIGDAMATEELPN